MESGQAVKKSSQTETQLSRLRAAIDRAFTLRATLETSISPILRVLPTNCDETAKEAEILVPMAATIKKMADDMNDYCAVFEQTIARIEL